MNYVFLYDDSFISLLNLIKILINKNIRPYNIKTKIYNPNLFEETIKLEVPDNDKIIMEIINNTNKQIFRIMYYVFLSIEENKELIIYYFYLNALKYKEKIIYMRNLKCVTSALKISKYVSRENHKFKGFVRFKELENKVLYAEIEPTNNILEILSHHFCKRLKQEYWIIKDVKRNLISIYDKKEVVIINGENFSLLTENVSEKEKSIENLWISFYNTIGIKERKNEKCRMNFMPKKYWKYLTEMREEYEKSN